jgi:hypothetical protein
MPTLESQVRAIQSRIDKNIRFGVARGLTRTAQHSSTVVKGELPAIFDRPTPFTLNAIAFAGATKTNLEAAVFIKDVQAQYLLMQQTGGTRVPQQGSPINVPIGQRTNVYGNIGRGVIGRAKAKKSTFVSKGQGRTAHLPPGLYERLGFRKGKGLGSKRGRKRSTGRGDQKSRVRLLVAFDKVATYQPQFGFQERAAKAAMSVLKGNVAASIVAAVQPMSATGPLGT